jgi:hypothetical protein
MENKICNKSDYTQALGISKCYQSYIQNECESQILDVGIDYNDGYSCLTLYNEIIICSYLGQDVKFMVVDCSFKEFTFNTMQEAELFNNIR